MKYKVLQVAAIFLTTSFNRDRGGGHDPLCSAAAFVPAIFHFISSICRFCCNRDLETIHCSRFHRTRDLWFCDRLLCSIQSNFLHLYVIYCDWLQHWLVSANSFLKCFWRTHSHVLFWGHCYLCFGFLVTPRLGFKAKVGCLICIMEVLYVANLLMVSIAGLWLKTTCTPKALTRNRTPIVCIGAFRSNHFTTCLPLPLINLDLSPLSEHSRARWPRDRKRWDQEAADEREERDRRGQWRPGGRAQAARRQCKLRQIPTRVQKHARTYQW